MSAPKKNKEEGSIARVTTFLKGKTKNRFFSDVENLKTKECHLAKEIIEKYYSDRK